MFDLMFHHILNYYLHISSSEFLCKITSSNYAKNSTYNDFHMTNVHKKYSKKNMMLFFNWVIKRYEIHERIVKIFG